VGDPLHHSFHQLKRGPAWATESLAGEEEEEGEAEAEAVETATRVEGAAAAATVVAAATTVVVVASTRQSQEARV